MFYSLTDPELTELKTRIPTGKIYRVPIARGPNKEAALTETGMHMIFHNSIVNQFYWLHNYYHFNIRQCKITLYLGWATKLNNKWACQRQVQVNVGVAAANLHISLCHHIQNFHTAMSANCKRELLSMIERQLDK